LLGFSEMISLYPAPTEAQNKKSVSFVATHSIKILSVIFLGPKLAVTSNKVLKNKGCNQRRG